MVSGGENRIQHFIKRNNKYNNIITNSVLLEFFYSVKICIKVNKNEKNVDFSIYHFS